MGCGFLCATSINWFVADKLGYSVVCLEVGSLGNAKLYSADKQQKKKRL